jgi:hypothetical protein
MIYHDVLRFSEIHFIVLLLNFSTFHGVKFKLYVALGGWNNISMYRSSLFIIMILLLMFPWMEAGGQHQGINRKDYQISIRPAGETIKVDGILDEHIWSEAERAGRFHRVLPTDTGYAQSQTEVMLTYDAKHLYLGIICHDTFPGTRPVESLRRDWAFGNNDNFIVFIDTYNDYTNGFGFGVSAAGAQWDGNHGEGGFIMQAWDIKWMSAVQNYQDRWVAEFSIPFRSLRYRENVLEWGINFSRLDLKTSEKSSWAPVPRQFPTASLAFTGTLLWDKPLPKAGIRFSLIPYVSGIVIQDKEEGERISKKASAGLDAKVILSTSMNLDLTISPDYSQVEVDEQRTDLDRFELFFPEKRQFFLENSDIFADLGSEDIRPFFSRRIGLENPVIAGARLSGKIGEKWRTGIMDIQTSKEDTFQSYNFAVAAFQRQVLSRSNITAFLVNKQLVNDTGDSTVNDFRFNRVAGMDFNLASADNRWTGKFFYHQSFYPSVRNDAATLSGLLTYNTETFSISLGQNYIGRNYQAETGYIRRTGIYQNGAEAGYKFFPASRTIAYHGPVLELESFFDYDLSLTDLEAQLSYQIGWLNQSIFAVDYEQGYVRLLEAYDPVNKGGVEIEAGNRFSWSEVSASYFSDNRRLFTYGLNIRYGGFYNGTRLSLEGKASYRVQPYGSIMVAGSLNRVHLPAPYSSADLVLIGPRLDLTFTENLFFTMFVQYNNQIDNLNTNIRFQWRFAPVSDLFIVFTDNAFPENLKTKDRGLVVKLSYWFN